MVITDDVKRSNRCYFSPAEMAEIAEIFIILQAKFLRDD